MAASGLLILCLLWALGSLRSDLFPFFNAPALPAMEQQAMPFALLAFVSAVFAVLRGARWPGGKQLGSAALLGLALFVVPSLLDHFARSGVTNLTRVALYSLAPVFAVVLEPYIGRSAGVKGGLIAAMVAVAGTLCIFPVEVPRSLHDAIGLAAVIAAVAMVAAANCWAVVLVNELPVHSTASLAAMSGAIAAVGFLVQSALTEKTIWNVDVAGPNLAWSALFELPALLLLFWLMRRMSAARMTIRFVIAPLIANLIAMALFRPPFDLRTGLGLLLIAGGAGWLLFGQDEDGDTRSGPLSLKMSG